MSLMRMKFHAWNGPKCMFGNSNSWTNHTFKSVLCLGFYCSLHMTLHAPHFQVYFSSRFKVAYLCQFCTNWLEIWNVSLSTCSLGACSVLCSNVMQYKICFLALNMYPLQCSCQHPKDHPDYLINSEHLRNTPEEVYRQSQIPNFPFAYTTAI